MVNFILQWLVTGRYLVGSHGCWQMSVFRVTDGKTLVLRNILLITLRCIWFSIVHISLSVKQNAFVWNSIRHHFVFLSVCHEYVPMLCLHISVACDWSQYFSLGSIGEVLMLCDISFRGLFISHDASCIGCKFAVQLFAYVLFGNDYV